MKSMRLLIAVLLFALCVAANAVDISAYSGNRIRAGLAVGGQVNWASSSSIYHTGGGSSSQFPFQWFDDNGAHPSDLQQTIVTWETTGRWFVTTNMNKTHLTLVNRGTNKSINNEAGKNLTLMFSDSCWHQTDGYELFYTGDYRDSRAGNTGECYPAGKFCLFRVRVTDFGGANERYYWVGDTNTGNFSYAKEWNYDNSTNTPGKGRYGEFCEAVWSIPSENIEVHFNITCIYDQARFAVNVVNNATSTKYISVAMYGTPATSDNPAGEWGRHRYYNFKYLYDDDGNINGYSEEFDDALRIEEGYTLNPVYFYLSGIGNISKGTIFKRGAVPEKLEMYAYRFNTTNKELPWVLDYQTYQAGEERVDNPDLGNENINSTYLLPPASSWININLQEQIAPTRTPANDSSLHAATMATFDNGGDATKPDYLIIDFSSNMLNTGNQNFLKMYPFGQWGLVNSYAMDDGALPTNTLWPKDEAGVLTPYEDSLEESNLYSYVDQHQDPLSYMAIWASEPLSPGAHRQVITYFGLAGKDFVNGTLNGNIFRRQNHSLFVESPSILGYKVTKDEYGKDSLNPTTFKVKVLVTNEGIEKNYYDFKVKKVKITLPDGLELASTSDGDGGTFAKSEELEDDGTNTYFVNKNVKVTMASVYDGITIELLPDGIISGDVKYTVKIYGQDVSGGAEWVQQVTRGILIPTTKNGIIYGGPGNLLACPFKNVTVNGSEGDNPFTVTDVFGQDTVGFTWNSEKQEYEKLSDLNSLRLNPQGFWVLKGVDEDSDKTFSYKYPAFTKPNDINYGDVEDSKYYMAETELDLNKGWNIFSNPFVYPLLWSNVVVKNKITGEILNVSDAVDAGWLYKTIFTWEPQKDASGSMVPELSRYVGQSAVNTKLVSNKGYWIYATRALHIYFKPTTHPDSRIYDDEYYNDPDKFFQMGNTSDENYE
ncbi:MAG: hypothetical protein IJS60_04740 [Abditibacteriota bacterium]|nr:hypothetical protein [Abditibacteriota bacterium]